MRKAFTPLLPKRDSQKVAQALTNLLSAESVRNGSCVFDLKTGEYFCFYAPLGRYFPARIPVFPPKLPPSAGTRPSGFVCYDGMFKECKHGARCNFAHNADDCKASLVVPLACSKSYCWISPAKRHCKGVHEELQEAAFMFVPTKAVLDARQIDRDDQSKFWGRGKHNRNSSEAHRAGKGGSRKKGRSKSPPKGGGKKGKGKSPSKEGGKKGKGKSPFGKGGNEGKSPFGKGGNKGKSPPEESGKKGKASSSSSQGASSSSGSSQGASSSSRPRDPRRGEKKRRRDDFEKEASHGEKKRRKSVDEGKGDRGEPLSPASPEVSTESDASPPPLLLSGSEEEGQEPSSSASRGPEPSTPSFPSGSDSGSLDMRPDSPMSSRPSTPSFSPTSPDRGCSGEGAEEARFMEEEEKEEAVPEPEVLWPPLPSVDFKELDEEVPSMELDYSWGYGAWVKRFKVVLPSAWGEALSDWGTSMAAEGNEQPMSFVEKDWECWRINRRGLLALMRPGEAEFLRMMVLWESDRAQWMAVMKMRLRHFAWALIRLIRPERWKEFAINVTEGVQLSEEWSTLVRTLRLKIWHSMGEVAKGLTGAGWAFMMHGGARKGTAKGMREMRETLAFGDNEIYVASRPPTEQGSCCLGVPPFLGLKEFSFGPDFEYKKEVLKFIAWLYRQDRSWWLWEVHQDNLFQKAAPELAPDLLPTWSNLKGCLAIVGPPGFVEFKDTFTVLPAESRSLLKFLKAMSHVQFKSKRERVYLGARIPPRDWEALEVFMGYLYEWVNRLSQALDSFGGRPLSEEDVRSIRSFYGRGPSREEMVAFWGKFFAGWGSQGMVDGLSAWNENAGAPNFYYWCSERLFVWPAIPDGYSRPGASWDSSFAGFVNRVVEIGCQGFGQGSR